MINYDTYVRVDLNNIAYNVKQLLTNYPDYQYYIGVVKGFGYGHGLYVAKTMVENGINYLAVATLEEAIKIRTFDEKTPILCLEPINLIYIEDIIKYNITLTMHTKEYAQELVNLNRLCKVHLKVDSGMNRLGFRDATIIGEVHKQLTANGFEVEGIYSHMSSVGFFDNAYDLQVSSFERLISEIDLSMFKMVHLDRSLTMVTHKKQEYTNGVRVGIMLYGYNQLPEFPHGIRKSLGEMKRNILRVKYSEVIREIDYDLKPAFEVVSSIFQINELDEGARIGYGGEYQTIKKTRVAIVAVGYADGLNLNHKLSVLINDRNYPIVGSIDMKMIAVEIDDDVTINDDVIIVGGNLKAQSLAKSLNITVYKFMCNFSIGLPRVYFRGNKEVYIEEGKVM